MFTTFWKKLGELWTKSWGLLWKAITDPKNMAKYLGDYMKAMGEAGLETFAAGGAAAQAAPGFLTLATAFNEVTNKVKEYSQALKGLGKGPAGGEGKKKEAGPGYGDFTYGDKVKEYIGGGLGPRPGIEEVDELAYEGIVSSLMEANELTERQYELLMRLMSPAEGFADGLKSAFEGSIYSAEQWGQAVGGTLNSAVGQLANLFTLNEKWAWSLKEIDSVLRNILNSFIQIVMQQLILQSIKMVMPFLFQEGGMVPGALGQPVPAIVHGGELVLNPKQQQELLHPKVETHVHTHDPSTWIEQKIYPRLRSLQSRER
jgi:hypothetical protein